MSCHLVCCFVHEHFLCGGNYGPSLPVCGENRKLGQLRTQCKGFFLHPIKCGYYFKCINCINLLHRWLLWYTNTPNIYTYVYIRIYIIYITYWSAVCFSQIDSIRQTLFTHWHLAFLWSPLHWSQDFVKQTITNLVTMSSSPQRLAIVCLTHLLAPWVQQTHQRWVQAFCWNLVGHRQLRFPATQIQ